MTEAVPVRDAATVVLLRDGAAGVESWLLTRVRQMVFAPGMTVFPGGRVDDGDAALPWVGHGDAAAGVDDGAMARRLGCTRRQARALVGAAVRETFEETGLLLTVPTGRFLDERPDVEAGRLPFADLLARHDMHLDAGALRPWARWITPQGEVRRYDTRFFVAALSSGAAPEDVTTESSVAAWEPVREAVVRHDRGERAMLPPTITTLRDIAPHATVADVLAASDDRQLSPVEPVLVHTDGGIAARLPDGTVLPLRPTTP